MLFWDYLVIGAQGGLPGWVMRIFLLRRLAIGYPDEEAVVNRFKSGREPLEKVVYWTDLT